LDVLDDLLLGLDESGRQWLAGYVAGFVRARARAPQPSPQLERSNGAGQEQQSEASTLTVLYGSQTGNSKRLAEALAQKLGNLGHSIKLKSTNHYDPRQLKDERYLLVVISTQGDGDPPDDARAFLKFLNSARAGQLPHLNYAVLGLGDSSYPKFCEIAKQLDARLSALGAARWLPRADADVDIDVVANPWLDAVLAKAQSIRAGSLSASAQPTPVPTAEFGREQPVAATVLENQRITASGAIQPVYHLEFALEASGLRYEPGDALGVWPSNPEAAVSALLALFPNQQGLIARGEQSHSLQKWLSKQLEITRITPSLLKLHAERAGDQAISDLLEPSQAQALKTFLRHNQVLDVIKRAPQAWDAASLVQALRPQSPRLYSIASSMVAVGEEAHLTIAAVTHGEGELKRLGAASNDLAHAAVGDTRKLFVERNERFRLPKDGARDIIMIGAGTGVAPFRGFLQERVANGSSGRNWLIFGNRHARKDFLYQAEWLEQRARGNLARIDVAFSRDGASKHYVQHEIVKHGRALFEWLELGAHLYLCGDASAMAPAVERALLEILQAHGDFAEETARDKLDLLIAEGRFARDVY
jgi:sulfite reductase (NADPH) flavoprotein alpha-component